MGRAIFAEADGIVGQDVNGRDLRDRGQSHCRTHVVGEVEKSAAKRAHFDHRHPIQRGTHGVLADTEVNVPPTIVLGTEYTSALELKVGLIRGRKISGSTNQPW